jgi:hypothetical protein
MEALACLADQVPDLRPEVEVLIKARVQGGSPSVRSRGRRLLDKLSVRLVSDAPEG